MAFAWPGPAGSLSSVPSRKLSDLGGPTNQIASPAAVLLLLMPPLHEAHR